MPFQLERCKANGMIEGGGKKKTNEPRQAQVRNNCNVAHSSVS